MDTIDRWDEARVGFRDVEKETYRPGNVFKRGVVAVRRRQVVLHTRTRTSSNARNTGDQIDSST